MNDESLERNLAKFRAFLQERLDHIRGYHAESKGMQWFGDEYERAARLIDFEYRDEKDINEIVTMMESALKLWPRRGAGGIMAVRGLDDALAGFLEAEAALDRSWGL
jgi:hypothetical protein